MFSFDPKKICDISNQQSNIKFIYEKHIIRDFLCKVIQPFRQCFSRLTYII